MGKIGKNFNTGLVGNQMTGIKGTNLFSIGNAFNVQTNTNDRNVKDYDALLGDFSEPITLETLNINNSKTFTNNFSKALDIKFNFDKSEIKNYALFGSLKDYLKVSIEGIVEKYPASLFINNLVENYLKINILDYSYNKVINTTSFKIPTTCIVNNYNIKIDNNKLENSRDLIKTFDTYNILDLDTKNEFNLIGFTGTTTNQNTYVFLEVSGNPFPAASGGTLSKIFHIKPNSKKVEEFFFNLNDLESYLLNRNIKPKYSAQFSVPKETDEGSYILVDETYTWPSTDGYNLDNNSIKFDEYLADLILLGENFDLYKTNLISRFLTSSAIKDFDTVDGKMNSLLKVYGREFDEINKYITGLAHVYKVSYDKKDNTPDVLIKNLAKTLGWETLDIVSNDDFFDKYLNVGNEVLFSGTSKNMTPAELDVELWRRIITNTSYLFKSKGTRKAIEFVFRMIGAPEYLIDFNEYVYTLNKKIDVNSVPIDAILTLPIDSEGYPSFEKNDSDFYFQMKGGWLSETTLNSSSSPVGVHLGPYDNGKLYFDEFKSVTSQGVKLEKTVDNKKSWTENFIKSDVDINTNYIVSDNKLILNSKEVDIFLDSAKAIEYDVYRRNYNLEIPINSSGLTYPYPDNVNTRKNVDNMSFYEYLKFVYENFINVKNRKVIQSYPTLKKIYEEYLKLPSSLDNFKLSDYIDEISSIWTQLGEQLIPSTTIWNGGNKYKNTVFDRQKHIYKHGINDGSEFRKEQNSYKSISITTSPELIGKVRSSIKGQLSGLNNLTVSYTSSRTGGSNNAILNNTLSIKEFTQGTVVTLSPPEFYLNGTSKIVTGITTPILWKSEQGFKPLEFIFTGNTSSLNIGENPIYEFEYKVLPRVGSGFSVNSIQSSGFSVNYFSGQTGNGIKTLLDTFKSDEENEFIVKGSFKYSATTANTTLTGSTGVINNSNVYGSYDVFNDWYFVQLKTPSSPVIANDFIVSGNTADLTGINLVNKTIIIDFEDQTDFIIPDKPIGDMIVHVNGLNLMKSSSSSFTDDGEFYQDTTLYSGGTLIKLSEPLSLDKNDILTVSFLKANQPQQFTGNLKTIYSVIDTPVVSGTGYPGAKLIYNPTTQKTEYWFSQPVNSDISPNLGDMIVSVNGVFLTKGIDWAYSTSSSYRIIFLNDIVQGDTLFVVSGINSVNNVINNNNLTINFADNTYKKYGEYTVEITTSIDVNFNSPIISKKIDYNTGTTLPTVSYSVPVGVITGATQTYIVRVKSENYYKTLMNEIMTSTNYSDVLSFTTNNNNIIGY